MVVSTRTGLVNEMRLAEGDETRRFGKRGQMSRGEGENGAKERGLKGLKGRSDWVVCLGTFQSEITIMRDAGMTWMAWLCNHPPRVHPPYRPSRKLGIKHIIDHYHLSTYSVYAYTIEIYPYTISISIFNTSILFSPDSNSSNQNGNFTNGYYPPISTDV